MTPSFSLDLPVTHRYLRLPVTNGAPVLTARLWLGEQMVREFTIELAPADPPDWWAFYDVGGFAGQALRLEIENSDSAAQGWLAQAIHLSDTPLDPATGSGDLYRERFRPQLHFTVRRGWNNDPNGMVYQAGEWHLYYQHNPFGVGWGNMHWGHAASPDLVHWQELDEALYQRSLGDMAFSGGGLVDHANTAGFQQGDEPPLVVAFTSTGRGECLAYSNDRGRTLTEWDGNPFLVHQGRDPKIIWYPEQHKWVMIVYEELGDAPDSPRGYALYDSPDLKRWRRTDFLPGLFECPELFRLPLDGNPANPRWVMYGARWEGPRSTCLVGDFDGERFTIQAENPTSHFGPHFYAAQIFNDAPAGRAVMVGWLAGPHYPGMPFSQGMSVPLELSLRSTPGGPRLCFNPVRELVALRASTTGGACLTLEEANRLLSQASDPLELELLLHVKGPLALDVRGHLLAYDPAAGVLSFAGSQAALATEGDEMCIRVLVDRCVTEVFAMDGQATFAAITLFDDPARPIQLEGQVAVKEIRVHTLRSMWE